MDGSPPTELQSAPRQAVLVPAARSAGVSEHAKITNGGGLGRVGLVGASSPYWPEPATKTPRTASTTQAPLSLAKPACATHPRRTRVFDEREKRALDRCEWAAEENPLSSY